LEFNQNTSDAEIKKAFKKLSLKYHPVRTNISLTGQKSNSSKLLMLMKPYQIPKREKYTINMVKKVLRNKKLDKTQDKVVALAEEVSISISEVVETLKTYLASSSSREDKEEDSVEVVSITNITILRKRMKSLRRKTTSLIVMLNSLKWITFLLYIVGKKFGFFYSLRYLINNSKNFRRHGSSLPKNLTVYLTLLLLTVKQVKKFVMNLVLEQHL
jgi:hypothetical protein